MRKQQVLDLVLGGNQRVEFPRLFILDGFQQERHSPLVTTKVESEPLNGSNADIPNQCKSEQALNVSVDISKNKASRNFDLIIIKWCLLKITLQAPFLNVQKTVDRSRSSLGLHGNDVCSHQFRPRSSSN
ncbi:hypothetical protein Tco_0306882, partial [Tanacetum coccineum]